MRTRKCAVSILRNSQLSSRHRSHELGTSGIKTSCWLLRVLRLRGQRIRKLALSLELSCTVEGFSMDGCMDGWRLRRDSRWVRRHPSCLCGPSEIVLVAPFGVRAGDVQQDRRGS